MTPNVLITAGNINNRSFEGILLAIHQSFEEINYIMIFDSPQSNSESINKHREAFIRGIYPNVDITTVVIEDRKLQQVIPEKISQYIGNFGIENLLVDLSNGQKITTSILYAVATISKIPNIYVLDLRTRIEQDKTIQDYEKGKDWSYLPVEPLKEILNITRSAQLELIYYRERIEKIICNLINANFRNVSECESNLKQSLINYFPIRDIEDESQRQINYESIAVMLGKVIETVSAEYLMPYCIEKKLADGAPKKFSDIVKHLISKWEYYNAAIKNNESNKLMGEEKFIKMTLALPALLDAIRIYRNAGAHPGSRIIYSKEDIRLVLDITFLVLEKLIETNVLYE